MRKRRSRVPKTEREKIKLILTSAGSSTSTTVPSLSVAVNFTKGNDDAGGKPPWRPMTEGEEEEEVEESLLLLGVSALSAAADAVTSSRRPAIRLARPSVENSASQSRGRGTFEISSS